MIITNIAHTVHMTFTVFSKFSKWLFVLHLLAYSKFELHWFSPSELWWTMFNSSFQTLRTVCIWDLQCFQSFRNCCLFCTFWLIRNFYSGHEQHVNYSKHSLNDHFQHCAHCVYDFTVFAKFSKWLFVLHILAYSKFELHWFSPF